MISLKENGILLPAMRTRIILPSSCLALLVAGACVSKSAYDAVRADLDATKAELDSNRAQSQILTQQIADLEQLKADMEKKWIQANDDLEYTKKSVENEMAARQERLNKLTAMVRHLSTQQAVMRGAIQRAEEERPALQSTVDMYKRKLDSGEGFRASTLAPESQQPLNTAVSQPDSRASAPAQPGAPAPAATPPPQAAVDQPVEKPQAPPPAAPPTELADEGWISTITGWLKSIWHSLFS